MNTQELKTMEYIKQLEKENKLLKEKLLSSILDDNAEITRLNFKIDMLQKTIEDLK